MLRLLTVCSSSFLAVLAVSAHAASFSSDFSSNPITLTIGTGDDDVPNARRTFDLEDTGFEVTATNMFNAGAEFGYLGSNANLDAIYNGYNQQQTNGLIYYPINVIPYFGHGAVSTTYDVGYAVDGDSNYAASIAPGGTVDSQFRFADHAVLFDGANGPLFEAGESMLVGLRLTKTTTGTQSVMQCNQTVSHAPVYASGFNTFSLGGTPSNDPGTMMQLEPAPLVHQVCLQTFMPFTTTEVGYGWVDVARGSLIINGAGGNTGAAANAPGMSPVPLPAGLPLMLAGLGGFAFMRRRR